MNVGPAFTDTMFSLLLGGIAKMRVEYPDEEIVKDFGVVFYYEVQTSDNAGTLSGYGMVQIAMSIVNKFGSEVVERACKEGFVSIGRTPTKSRFDPPQIIKGDDLAALIHNIFQIEWPGMTCSVRELDLTSLTIS